LEKSYSGPKDKETTAQLQSTRPVLPVQRAISNNFGTSMEKSSIEEKLETKECSRGGIERGISLKTRRSPRVRSLGPKSLSDKGVGKVWSHGDEIGTESPEKMLRKQIAEAATAEVSSGDDTVTNKDVERLPDPVGRK